jgi:Flp pilus assembly protein TadG
MMTALAMTVLVAALGLAIDGGMLFRAKRQLQTAADAAATAAATNLMYGLSPAPAADSAASANGATNGVNGTVVTVNSPPQSGPFASSGYVQVAIQQPTPTYFMRIFGFNSVDVAAQAIAGDSQPSSGCVYLMSPSGNGLSLQGSYDVEATGCGVYVNSNSSDALSVTGSGGTFDGPYLDVVGGSGGHVTTPTAQTDGVMPISDPLGNITGPTPDNGGCTNTSSATSITGNYSAGDGGAVCFTSPVSLSNATLGAGIYVFEDGVSVSGTVSVNSGTLDIYGGTLNQASGSLLNITAPTSGTYNGIAILQPVTNTNQLQVQFGSNNQTLDGYIYAPGANVYLQDNGGGVTATGIIAASMTNKSSLLRLPSYNAANPNTTPVRTVSLVE